MSQNIELPPAPKFPAIGIMPNKAHQPDEAIFHGPGYTLIIVEFDDQGRCQKREQMYAFDKTLADYENQDTITIVFVHGWKHDGRSDDDNLTSFRSVLQNTAAS